jgi:uncharacterized phage-associated protein
LLSLLKIIYYAHGWYLIDKHCPLVEQPFEAWEHGPVVRAVWESFKGNGSAPLTFRAKRLNVIENSYAEVRDPIESEDGSFLQRIFDSYAHIDAYDLSSMTHLTGSPWDIIWNAPGGEVNVGMKIPNDEIQKWFSGRRAPGFLH